MSPKFYVSNRFSWSNHNNLYEKCIQKHTQHTLRWFVCSDKLLLKIKLLCRYQNIYFYRHEFQARCTQITSFIMFYNCCLVHFLFIKNGNLRFIHSFEMSFDGFYEEFLKFSSLVFYLKLFDIYWKLLLTMIIVISYDSFYPRQK